MLKPGEAIGFFPFDHNKSKRPVLSKMMFHGLDRRLRGRGIADGEKGEIEFDGELTFEEKRFLEHCKKLESEGVALSEGSAKRYEELSRRIDRFLG
ncbi:MAG: hypothetical protein JSV25_00875 [Spirochaetota bacterium]|nr:MAG: hypothetical protein JSV25_00875 [Spirochaetota bacterium]